MGKGINSQITHEITPRKKTPSPNKQLLRPTVIQTTCCKPLTTVTQDTPAAHGHFARAY